MSSFLLFPLQVFLYYFFEQLLHPFPRKGRTFVIHRLVFIGFQQSLLFRYSPFLNQIFLIPYDAYITQCLHNSIPYVSTFDSNSPSQQSIPLKLSASVRSNTSKAISASRQYKGMMDLNLSSPAVSQMFNCKSQPFLVFIFFYWQAPARVGSLILVNLPSLYLIVIDVLPTAALPHNTNLTAFLVVGLVSTLGCFSFPPDFLDEPKHMLSLYLINYDFPLLRNSFIANLHISFALQLYHLHIIFTQIQSVLTSIKLMSKKQGDLKFSYDNYEDDFHREAEQSGGKKDFNMQTVSPSPPLKKQQKKQETYEADFEDPTKSQVKSKVQDNSANRQKMIQQNIKLKTQIYELAKQMDEILAKEKKQKKYGIHADEEENEAVKEKKMQLKKQQIEIMQLKNKIFLTKRQLQHVYDSRGIQGKQDELKSLQKQLKALQSQKQGLLRVKKEQTKALKIMRNDGQYEEKVSKLKQQLSKLKEQCKVLSEKLLQNERILRKNHQQYITKQSRIKEMEMRIEEGKKKTKKGPSNNIVTVEMIAEVEAQINQLQRDRKQAEKSWQQKIHNIESQLQQRRLEQQKKLLILKQKQKELKLNEIRIKQLKKLIQHQNTENNRKNQPAAESDMKQYRHKRNIKYLKNQN